MSQLTRVCARCHAEKPIDAFPIKDKTRGTRRSYCLPCCREYGKEHYRRNKPAYLGRTRAQHASVRPGNRRFVSNYLTTHPCVDCGVSDPVVLEFDHRDPATKTDDVGRLVHSRNLAILTAEVLKCDVRCGNCHRRRTLLQFGSYRVWMGTTNA